MTQHVRSVVWQGRDQKKERNVYVTTMVKFGDILARCITITALRETAARYGASKEEAAWFLLHWAYMDDATTGVDTMEDLTRVSRELEEIAGNRGFTFKETLMTGDKMEESDKPRKVLGVEHRTGPASDECEGQIQQ